jgi:TPR repeat protein
MAHDVFISYSSKDKTTADAVCATLELNGVRCWIAPRDVTPSMEWGECIIDAIEECRIMVLVFTADADSSPQIRREVERAVNHGVPILPFRIEDVMPGKALEYFIGNVHWLDALTTPMEKHLEDLAGTTKMLLGRMEPRDATPPVIPMHPPISVPSDSDMPETFQPVRERPATVIEPTGPPIPPAPPVFEPPRASSFPAVGENSKKPLTRRLWFRALMGVAALIVLYLIVTIIMNVSGPDQQPQQGSTTAKNEAQATDWNNLDLSSVRAKADAGDAEAQLEMGLRHYLGRGGAEKNYPQAYAWFQKAADGGSLAGQFNLGVMNEKGQGVPQDFHEALRWYRKAADQGYAHAQFAIGDLYWDGNGVPKDKVEALVWYRKAADQGNSDAQNNLGNMYRDGDGVPKDYAKALEWYRKAADQGDANSEISMGYMYKEGFGVLRDFAQALVWYRKAADQGNAKGQLAMGVLYQYGEGVPRDLEQARIWYRKAADQGNADAEKQLAALDGK